MYADDEMLMLSGIQHFMFCPRQWGLIHLEQQWADNRLTAEGTLLHKNVDNPLYRRKRGDTVTLRSLHIASHTLGLYGITDAVELQPVDAPDDAIRLPHYGAQWWKPFPVEYKHGRSKPTPCDEVQLAAQAICLEEMHGIHVPHGAIYYDGEKHREVVAISPTLRATTAECARQMHDVFASGRLPAATPERHCRNCSLRDICMPETAGRAAVATYLKRNLYEDTP